MRKGRAGKRAEYPRRIKIFYFSRDPDGTIRGVKKSDPPRPRTAFDYAGPCFADIVSERSDRTKSCYYYSAFAHDLSADRASFCFSLMLSGLRT